MMIQYFEIVLLLEFKFIIIKMKTRNGEKMKVTVLCENSVVVPFPGGLMGEHGLAFLVEGEKTTLYDTAQGVGLMNNLKILGKNIDSIDRVIISHGHYDHTGGLMQFLSERKSSTPVYIHEDGFFEKVALIETEGQIIERPIGIQNSRKEYEEKGAEFKFLNNFTKMDKDLYTICDVKRPEGWKTWDTRLKCRKSGEIVDDQFNDDLSLLLETDSGPVVLLGCAHAGVVEILDNISAETGHNEFHAVLGGTHLGTAPLEYIDKSIDCLKKYKVKVIGTSHCTGFSASNIIRNRFEKEFTTASVGNSFDF